MSRSLPERFARSLGRRILGTPRKVIGFARPRFRGSVPWDDLDPDIEPRVRLLFGMGYKPFASCEGHDQEIQGFFGVVVSTEAWVHLEDGDPVQVYQRLVEAGDAPAQVMRVVQAGGEPYIRVVWSR